MSMKKSEILKETAKRNGYLNVFDMMLDCKVYPTVRVPQRNRIWLAKEVFKTILFDTEGKRPSIVEQWAETSDG